MFHKRGGRALVVIIRNHLVQNCIVTGLFCISADCSDQPQRVIVEAGADAGIAFLRKRLILVISTAVLELCRRDIDDSLPCPFRNQVHEAKKILTGIPEAHAAPDTGLVVRRGTAHVEGNHALTFSFAERTVKRERS